MTDAGLHMTNELSIASGRPASRRSMVCRGTSRGILRVFGWFSWSVARLLMLAIRVYKLVISPAQIFLFGATGGCRFTPSCSSYAMEALREHGPVTGTALAARRICRCHPWGGCGHDPVPPHPRKTLPSFTRKAKGEI